MVELDVLVGAGLDELDGGAEASRFGDSGAGLYAEAFGGVAGGDAAGGFYVGHGHDADGTSA